MDAKILFVSTGTVSLGMTGLLVSVDDTTDSRPVMVFDILKHKNLLPVVKFIEQFDLGDYPELILPPIRQINKE